MGGATSVMPVTRPAFSQQAAASAATTEWADTIDWTVRCDWLQVASFRKYTHNTMLMRAARLMHVLQDLLKVVSYL